MVMANEIYEKGKKRVVNRKRNKNEKNRSDYCDLYNLATRKSYIQKVIFGKNKKSGNFKKLS